MAFWLVPIVVMVVCLVREWRLAREEEVRERIRRAHRTERRELEDSYVNETKGD